jgi:hypothetical protein
LLIVAAAITVVSRICWVSKGVVMALLLACRRLLMLVQESMLLPLPFFQPGDRCSDYSEC